MKDISHRPDVSIVFTNWNTGGLLRDCIHSIYSKVEGLTYEIIVVDDGSTDDTVGMLKREFPEVQVIVNERNIGVAKSYNRGVAAAKGRFVQILNTDMLLVNNTPKILMDFLEQHPNVGACAGWLRNRDMTSQVSYGMFPSFPQAIVDAFFLNDFFPRAGLPSRGMYPDERNTEPMEVEYACGASMLVRKEIVDSLGFFDERFTSYCEETDFCYRVKHEAHLDVYFVPAAQIIHFGGASFKKARKYQIQLMCSSFDKFLTKYHGSVYSFCTRLLYAWHHGVKLMTRTLRYIFSPSKEKKDYLLNAWYVVRYSIAPNEDFTGK